MLEKSFSVEMIIFRNAEADFRGMIWVGTSGNDGFLLLVHWPRIPSPSLDCYMQMRAHTYAHKANWRDCICTMPGAKLDYL